MAEAEQQQPPKEPKEGDVPEDNLPVMTLTDVLPTAERPQLCTREEIPACAKAILRIFHPHPVKYVDMRKLHAYKFGRFQCDLCGNVAQGFSFHCFKCGYDVCDGCSGLLCGWPDDRPLETCPAEEMARRLTHLHQHPITLTNLEGLEGYGDEGRFFCDRCHRRDKGLSHHCKECGFDLCPTCIVKVQGTFKVHAVERKGAGILNDMKHRTLVRSRAECALCRAPCIVGKEHRWVRCNTCHDLDVCWDCFQKNRDSDAEKESDRHPLDHQWTDMMQLLTLIMREVKERSEKSAMESAKNAERLKIIPLEKSEFRVPMANVVFCPQCGASFDIHNPHNPRNHPDPAIDPNCKYAMTVLENGAPLSEEEQENYKCQICRKLLKAHMPVVAPACRHAFCLDCAVTALKSHQRCPVDGKPLKLEHLCKWPWMQEKLQALEVPCINAAAGCEVTCSIRDFAMHTEKCQHTMEGCKYREVGCYFVAPPEFLRNAHEQQCIFQQLGAYIRRNELNKKELGKEITALKDQIGAAQEQLALLLQERDFCYSSAVFEVEDDGPPIVQQKSGGTSGTSKTTEEDIATLRRNIDTAYNTTEAQSTPQRLTWDESLIHPEIVFLSNERRTATTKESYIVLGTVPVTKDQDFWWEVRVDTYPGVGSIRVGFSQNPKQQSRATKMLNFRQNLGEDQLSFAWVSAGSIRHDARFLCQNEERLRYDVGDYLGFMFHHASGELHFFRNRVWAHKLSKLYKTYTDPVTKRQSCPQWFPAASVSYTHYSITLCASGPMLVIPPNQLPK